MAKEEKEALTMKILLKILCAPMIAVLSVFVWLASKLVQISAVVMNFIAIAVGLGALCILFDGKTAQGTGKNEHRNDTETQQFHGA